MVTEVMENYRNEKVGQSPLILATAPAVIGNLEGNSELT